MAREKTTPICGICQSFLGNREQNWPGRCEKTNKTVTPSAPACDDDFKEME